MPDLTRVCKCGCGAPVTRDWARGHSSRGVNGYTGAEAIPGPDDPWWELDAGGTHDRLDIGEINPDDAPAAPTPGGDVPPAPAAAPGRDQDPILPDPPPAHGSKEWKRGGPKAPPRKPTRVTAGIRNDIDAKISFALEIPGRVWQARDPLCGGTFIEQRPEISAALTEIVCQSPDLIAWFAGGGGQFMLWLNLAAACWPVATIGMAHHVYHSIEIDDGQAEAEATRYAA